MAAAELGGRASLTEVAAWLTAIRGALSSGGAIPRDPGTALNRTNLSPPRR
jgi:hypothetical protein